MRTFLSLVIMPLPLFWIMLMAAFVLHKKKNKIWPKRILIVALIWLVIVSTPFVPNLLVKNLENRYPVISPDKLIQSNRPVHVLVLGVGFSIDERLPATGQLSEAATGRLAEGIRLIREIPGSTLITSGTKGKQNISQAEVLKNAAILLGVDSARIKMQTEPKNTWMEATEYKRLFGNTSQLIVVTSAAHMPRAITLFQKAGLQPVPAPTNYLIKKGSKRNFWFLIPSSGNIKKYEAAIHEYAGMLWYKIGGNS